MIKLKKLSLIFTVTICFATSVLDTLGSHTVLAADAQKSILFVKKAGENFQELSNNMVKELKKYKIKDFVVDERTTYQDFSDKVKSVDPSLMVLMDNKSVDLGIKWNKEQSKKVPGVAVMGLNLQSILKGNKYIAGVAFESPAYTLITQFRYVTGKPVKNVLVFYRKSAFSDIINQSTQQLGTENITLSSINVEQDGMDKEKIESFLKTKGEAYFAQNEKYDVIWVMLDSVILSKNLFTQFWMPAASKYKLPILTGVEQLVKPQMKFGSFAVTPNLPDLAGQAAQLVERILEENESPGKIGVEQLISVNKVARTGVVEFQSDRISDVQFLK